MNKKIDDTTMYQVLEAQADKFEQANAALDAIETELVNAGWSDPLQDTLQALIGQLTLDMSCGDAIRQWNQSPQQGSPRLKLAVDRTRSALQRLLERIDSVETVARGLKDRLEPRLDRAAQTREAVNAYRQASGRQGSHQRESS